MAKKTKTPAAEKDEAPPISSKELFDVTQKLCTEEMAVRVPGSSGDEQVRAFIAQQMAEMKLQPPGGTAATAAPAAAAAPAADATSAAPAAAAPAEVDASAFQQPVSLTNVRTRLLPGGAPTFKSTAGQVPVQIVAGLSDVVLLPGDPQTSISLRDAEVVFVGYGLTAPEFQWDDEQDA